MIDSDKNYVMGEKGSISRYTDLILNETLADGVTFALTHSGNSTRKTTLLKNLVQ